jgi:hypothetical protein
MTEPPPGGERHDNLLTPKEVRESKQSEDEQSSHPIIVISSNSFTVVFQLRMVIRW